MRIRLLSDIHAEFGFDDNLLASGDVDVLVIAGDLHVGVCECWSLLKRFADHVPHVVYVPGNHEFYKQDINSFEILKEWAEGTNIHFLNPGHTKIGDVTFIGAPLWTNFRDDFVARKYCANAITDFRIIKGFSTQVCTELYTNHLKYLQDAYNKLEGTKVIVTHFLPAIECIDPQYAGEGTINKYFANDLANWIVDLKDTPLWLFGHTHSNVDITIGDTRLVANPYGYGRNKNYSERFIEV